MKPFQKVTIIPTFNDADGRLHVGLIKHPKAGWQLCAGSVEEGEDPRDAAVRELHEETGEEVTPQQLKPLFQEVTDSSVLADDFATEVFALKRGWPIAVESEDDDSYRARYTEYLDEGIDFEITFNISEALVSRQVERHFFAAEVVAPENLHRKVQTDGHEFFFRFFEATSLPTLAEPYATWLARILSLLPKVAC